MRQCHIGRIVGVGLLCPHAPYGWRRNIAHVSTAYAVLLVEDHSTCQYQTSCSNRAGSGVSVPEPALPGLAQSHPSLPAPPSPASA
eukprot:1951670-Rhodomonas_salina.1